ncbi:MAG: tetratricopeptide repeat-containing glycosyltransferase family protein, partial [Ramlibacter sp.]
FLEAHIDLAGVLWRVSDFDCALAHARRAVAIAPEHPHAVRMLGTALLNLNCLEEAEIQLRRALQLQPDFALAQLDLALALLAAGRLDEGWPWYEQRWKETGQLQRPAFFDPAREWRGPQAQPLAGRRIAVYAEQGLGDVLQFVRYVPLLQAQGATVFCIVHAELAALLESSLPGVLCQGPQRQVDVDLHVALLSLPLHFKTTLATIPDAVPYLRAPAAAAQRCRERLAPWQAKFKVGIAWSGFLGQINNRNRAIPLGLLQPVLAFPGVQCFSLQKAAAGLFSDVAPGPEQLVDFTAGWDDFRDSAAMLEQLDLVITVDTSIAHLAGALGRPAWVLLAPNADWRWLLGRDDSPWYPSMQLFRRDFGEHRAAQVGRVVQALRVRMQHHAAA